MAMITPQQALQRLIEHREIFQDEMRELMLQIMRGEVSPVLMAALIVGLRVKKESIGEITGAATVMRELAVPLPLPAQDAAGRPIRQHLIDIVGTGGDGSFSFNISTASMFVAAAAGAQVAKHGGRSVSSRSGSADVLEALGAVIELEPAQVAACLLETGLGFMYAPRYHPAMKQVASLRGELGVRSLFNILGPLTNPAGAPNVLMGVFHPDLVGIQIRVLKRLGAQHAMVVWGEDGMDEISIGAPTLVGELRGGEIEEYRIKPQDFGLPVAAKSALEITDAEQSRQMLLEVLSGQAGPASDVVAFNSGAALYVAGRAASLSEGVDLARESLASGAAHAKMQAFITATQRLSAVSVS